MSERSAKAEWNGTLKEGEGSLEVGSGALDVPFSFDTRMGDEPGTNPEELIGAALAGCFSMALNATLEKKGTPAKSVKTGANVSFGKSDGGFEISGIKLDTAVDVPELSAEELQTIADEVKSTCPVGKALAGTDITVKASLAGAASN